MIKHNIYLAERQLAQLRQLSEELELTVSEIVRRVIDEHLEALDDKRNGQSVSEVVRRLVNERLEEENGQD